MYILFGAGLVGCATSPPEEESARPTEVETIEETTEQPETVVTEDPVEESDQPLEQDQSVEVAEPEAEPEEEPSKIEVSEELYDQTFTEVERTINELNEIISNRNFGAWQRYLTDNYRRTYSDPAVLEQSSQSAVLVRNNITLESLEDYFNFVVVPSRSNARLDDLVFVDEDTVEAIMEVNDRRYLLYLLKKTNDRWKIDTF